MREIAQTIGISTRSVQIYINEHISEEIGAPWKPFAPPVRKPNTAYLERRKHILEVIESDNSLNQHQMIEKLPDNLKCSRRTLQKDLRDMDITRKRLRHVPVERNDRSTIAERKAYAIELSCIPDEKLFFVDETGTNLHTNLNYGYHF